MKGYLQEMSSLHRKRNLFNTKRLILLGLMALMLSTSLVLTTGVASAKTASQVQQEVNAQLRLLPGGTQISRNAISYNHGNMIIGVADPTIRNQALHPNTGYGGCPEGWVCVWSGTNYTGSYFYMNAAVGEADCQYENDVYRLAGWYGFESYSSTNGAAVPVGIEDYWGYTVASIQAGVAHHDPNTSSNYYVYTMGRYLYADC